MSARTGAPIGASRRPRPAAGFTLAELLVSLSLFVVVVVGILAIFDFNGKLARAQAEIATMQQSLRVSHHEVVRLIRMAGRGPVPLRDPGKQIPRGVAVEVINNVAAGTQVGFTANVGPQVQQGTDILIVRGVLSSPIYQINNADASTFTKTDPAVSGTVRIEDESPTGVSQDLTPLIRTICDDSDLPEALVIISPLQDATYAVVELDPATTRSGVDCTAPASVETVTVSFKMNGTHGAAYNGLSPNGAFPDNLTSAAFVGVLEEYRFYVRPVAAGTDLQPKFSRARVFPGTDAPYANSNNNWQVDIADNVFDLQVAMGLDSDDNGTLADAGDAGDEWLFNHSNDNAGESKWNTIVGSAPPRGTPLYYLRLSLLARTGRRDLGYKAPILVAVEDHAYPANDPLNTDRERMYRRRMLQTVVDMRNLS